MAGPAILSECAMCQVPLEICRYGNGDIYPRQVTGEHHFCSDTCRELAKMAGWEKGMTESPRKMFRASRIVEIPPCTACVEAGRKRGQIHTSGICWNCHTVSCGECISVRKITEDGTCHKCGSDLLDPDGLRQAYETCADISKQRIISRIYGGYLEKKGPKKWAKTVLETAMGIGDFQSHYSDLGRFGKPRKGDKDLVLQYFYFAVLDHPSSQTAVGKLWGEGLVPGGVTQGWETKQEYWYDQAGRNGDKVACFNLGLIYKDSKDFPRFLCWMKEAGRLGHEEAFHEMGMYWRNLGCYELAGENFDKGSMIQAGLCSVQYGIGLASGVYGYKQDIQRGKDLVERMYKIGKNYEKGSNLNRAYIIARDWLGSVYYGDPTISVIVKGFPLDKVKAIKLLTEGVEEDDPVCMILLGKIFLQKGDVKFGKKLINQAASTGFKKIGFE